MASSAPVKTAYYSFLRPASLTHASAAPASTHWTATAPSSRLRRTSANRAGTSANDERTFASDERMSASDEGTSANDEGMSANDEGTSASDEGTSACHERMSVCLTRMSVCLKRSEKSRANHSERSIYTQLSEFDRNHKTNRKTHNQHIKPWQS